MKRLLLALALLFAFPATARIVQNPQPVGNGAAASAASGNVTPALYTTPVQDDVALLGCVSKDNVAHSAAAGWTQKMQASQTATTQISVWWRRMQSGDAAPLVTHTAGSEIICRIQGFRNVAGVGSGQGTDPFDTVSGAFTATNTTPVATASITTTVAQGLVVHIVGAGISTSSTNAFSAPTGLPSGLLWSTSAGSTTVRATIAMYAQQQTAAGSTGAAGLAFSVAPATASGYASALLTLAPFTGKIYNLQDAAAWGSAQGTLAEGNAPTVVRLTTGWTAGTTASTNYALMLYGTTRAAATFGGTAQPAGAPTTTDTWRTMNPQKGVYTSGTWPISMAFRSSVAYTGRFQIQMRVWQSANQNCSSASEITSGAVTLGPSVANLSTTVNTNLTLSWSAPTITLNQEYLCFQMAAQITSVGGGGTQNILFVADPSASRVITTMWTEDATADVSSSVDTMWAPPNDKPSPNGTTLVGNDESAHVVMIKDNTSGKAGDLFTFIQSAIGGNIDNYYVFASTDSGVTWAYYSASNAEPNPDVNKVASNSRALCQDTSTGKVHYVGIPSLTIVEYSRITLAYDGNGHINGWAWDVQRLDSITPDTNAGQIGPHLDLQEIIDGNGVHRLLLTAYDQTNLTTIVGRVIASVTSTALGLAPAVATDWKKITSSTTSGFDVLGAFSLTAATDAAAAINFTNLSTYTSVAVHGSDVSAGQLPADKSLHFLAGGYYYNDLFPAPGSIWRWRATVSGSNWVLDGAATGTVLVTDNGTYRPMMGHLIASANYMWMAYVSPAGGFLIDKINTSGTVTANAIASPDTTTNSAGYIALSISADETKAWLMWVNTPQGATASYERTGYYNGSSWVIYDDTWTWGQNGWSLTNGATNWSHTSGWTQGVSVWAYGFDTYSLTIQKYHVHTFSSPVPPANTSAPTRGKKNTRGAGTMKMQPTRRPCCVRVSF